MMMRKRTLIAVQNYLILLKKKDCPINFLRNIKGLKKRF